MAYDLKPYDVADPRTFNDWYFVRQFWAAVWERQISLGHFWWPDPTHVYYSGVITSMTYNSGTGDFTLTDSSATGWVNSGRRKWVEGTVGVGADLPEWSLGPPFDVVIDDDPYDATLRPYPDPRRVIRGLIFDNTTTTLKVHKNLDEYVAQGVASTVASFAGRRYWILRQNGEDWTRGFPKAPNDFAYTGGTVASSTTTTIQAKHGIRNPGELAGKAIFYKSGGVTKTVAVSSATNDGLITFSGGTAAADADTEFYVLYSTTGLCRWDNTNVGGFLQSFYGGATELFYGVNPDGNVIGVPMPADTVLVSPRGTDLSHCDLFPPAEKTFKVDAYIPYDEICTAKRDHYLCPNIHKTINHLWEDIRHLCDFYVEDKDWTNSPSIHELSVAGAFELAGVNAYAGTAGTWTSGTSVPCTIAVPHTPVTVWWTIYDSTGNILAKGFDPAYDGTTLNGGFTTLSAAVNGMPVKITLGPTQYMQRRVRAFRDSYYFVADTSGSPPALQTVSNSFPGVWQKRAKSTHCLYSSDHGYVTDSTLSRHAFANGQVCTFAGDNAYDPGYPIILAPTSPENPQKTHYGYAADFERIPTVEAAINNSAIGVATGGSNKHLVAAVNWLTVDYYPGSNGYTHNGTFTSGSTSTGTDSTKGGTALWAAVRFSGFTGALVGFTCEVLISGSGFSDPAAVIEKRIITASNSTTGQLTFGHESFSVSVSGKTYRIREPYVLNRWADLKVMLTKGASSATVDIIGNHDDHLFISDPGFAVDNTTEFRIVRHVYGGKYKRVAGAWVETSPAALGTTVDARTGANWRVDIKQNCCDHLTEYGDVRPLYVTYYFPLGWYQMGLVLDVLTKHTGQGVSSLHTDANRSCNVGWHAETSSCNTYKTNVISGDGSGFPAYYNNTANFYGQANPTCGFLISGLWTWTGSAYVVAAGWTGNVIRQSARYDYTPTQSPIPKDVEFYNFSTKGGFETYNDNGDLVVENLWRKFSTVFGVGTSVVTSGFLGTAPSTPAPVAPTCPSTADLPVSPPTGSYGASHSTGYLVTQLTSLEKPTLKFVGIT